MRAFRRVPLWALATAMLLVLLLLIVYAGSEPQPSRPPVRMPRTSTPTYVMPSPVATPAPELPELAGDIADIESRYGVSIGLGIAPIAAPGEVTTQPWQGGSLHTGLAWNTIDVPIAMAVSTAQNQPTNLTYLLTRAITDDSSAGDEAMWQFLGTPEQAGAALKATLASAGDTSTTLPADETDDASPFPIFTKVWWSQADAAQFMGVFFCMSQSWPVLYHMTAGEPGGFGLASLQPSRVRTSYGKNDDALYKGYTVRQVGVVYMSDDSQVGVSLTAMADDGTLETAEAAMTAVASLLPDLTGFPGYC